MPLRLPSSRPPLASRLHAGGAGAVGAAGVHAVDQRGEHVELLGVGVLGEVVLARDRAEHLGGDLVGLADQRR